VRTDSLINSYVSKVTRGGEAYLPAGADGSVEQRWFCEVCTVFMVADIATDVPTA
jgi:hypothetical protein